MMETHEISDKSILGVILVGAFGIATKVTGYIIALRREHKKLEEKTSGDNKSADSALSQIYLKALDQIRSDTREDIRVLKESDAKLREELRQTEVRHRVEIDEIERRYEERLQVADDRYDVLLKKYRTLEDTVIRYQELEREVISLRKQIGKSTS